MKVFVISSPDEPALLLTLSESVVEKLRKEGLADVVKTWDTSEALSCMVNLDFEE